jgi:hypothetical protein
MRLYTNDRGSWVGTQADAKRDFGKEWREVEVPVNKTSLLEFLNFFAVGDMHVAPIDSDSVRTAVEKHPMSCSAKPNVYDVKDAALNADMKSLTQAVAVWINRLEEEGYHA